MATVVPQLILIQISVAAIALIRSNQLSRVHNMSKPFCPHPPFKRWRIEYCIEYFHSLAGLG